MPYRLPYAPVAGSKVRGRTRSEAQTPCSPSPHDGTRAVLRCPALEKKSRSRDMAKYALAPARIRPLLQPKVEIMMAAAIRATPAPGKMASSVAVATRSDGACWIASSGSVTR
ncbi:MAG: hypothetical protein A3H29_03700 [Acidobacteria bacterium RIFCSPLOWO2_02_FULL_67_21]|nr:MAG: hypothetical protein A3H29_03700 [Acidobacteria bacterium RIFCSPLOWO2_02_FULL_67_21]